MECEDDIINPDFNSYDNEETNYDEVFLILKIFAFHCLSGSFST